MNKEKMVKKIMESSITIDNIKEVLISELKDDRVECIGQLEDLKLHDVSYYIGEKLGEVDGLSNEKCDELYCHIFNLFCEDNYNIFEEDEKNYNIKRVYLGHTSSFYIESSYHDIIDSYYYPSNYREEYDLEEKKSMLLDEFLFNQLGIYEDCIEDYYSTKEDFIYMLNEYEDFLDTIEDIYGGYEYIRDFKENQIDIFKDWYNDVYKEYYNDILNGEIEK